MERRFCDPCDKRDISKSAFQWCSECEQYLCSDCVGCHMTMSISTNHHLVEADKKLLSSTNLWSKYCEKHEELPLTYFCTYHDELFCTECLAEAHRTCDKVISVEIASKQCKNSKLFNDLFDQVKQNIEFLNLLVNNRKLSMKNIKDETKNIKQKIRKAKEKLLECIEKQEKELLVNLEKITEKYSYKAMKTIDEAEKLVMSSTEQKAALEFVKDHGSDKQAFLLVHTQKKRLIDIDAKVVPLCGSNTKDNLCFTENAFSDSVFSIGEIKVVESPEPTTLVSLKLSESQVHITSFDSDEVNMDGAGNSYAITGMAMTDRNLLLLCDVKNSRIMTCRKDVFRSFITIPYTPWDIAALSSTAIVTSRDDNYLQFVDLDRKELKKKKKMKEIAKGGISVFANNIFVGANGKIHVLDSEGEHTRTLDIEAKGTICYLCISFEGNISFCDESDLVRTVNEKGKLLFWYSSPDLELTRKLVSDQEGNVYVVGENSHNIHRISRNGSFIGIVSKDEDRLYYPQAICFNKDYTKLYIANKFHDIRILRLT